jgi:predicted kinase
MAPLFGSGMAGGKRDILEGRLIWVAHRVLRAGVSVILDFGCWSAEERQALRAIADLSGADFELQYLNLPEDETTEAGRGALARVPGADLRDDPRRS